MEFKRIDDTKFQCLLDEDDLEDNNISLDDFFRNDTKKIHGLLDVILEDGWTKVNLSKKLPGKICWQAAWTQHLVMLQVL